MTNMYKQIISIHRIYVKRQFKFEPVGRLTLWVNCELGRRTDHSSQVELSWLEFVRYERALKSQKYVK